MVGFIRLGSDNSENFYQIEVPLKVTQPSNCTALSSILVWPEENQMDLSLELLTKLKLLYKKVAIGDLPAVRKLGGVTNLFIFCINDGFATAFCLENDARNKGAILRTN